MITQANTFDLGSRALLFRPSTADAYRVSNTAAVFSAGGSPVPLKDDDSSLQNLGFSFPFYGKAYTSVQLNSDGNLTFVVSDSSSDARDIGRFRSGPPRIGPLFTDLDPSSAGPYPSGMTRMGSLSSGSRSKIRCASSKPFQRQTVPRRLH